MSRSWTTVISTFSLCMLSGCSSLHLSEDLGVLRLDPTNRISLAPVDFSSLPSENSDVAAAIAAYNEGRPDVASGLMNRAIQAFPSDARLHYGNGMIYLGWSEIGFAQYRGLAHVALRLAIQLDPGNSQYALTLGRILLEDRNYESAVIALGHAVNQDPSDILALEELAQAAYFAQHFSVAKWASDLAYQSRHGHSGFLQLAALANAAAGDTESADKLFSEFVEIEKDPARRRRLARALGEWSTVRYQASTTQAGPEDMFESQQPPARIQNSAEAARAGNQPLVARWDTCDQIPKSPVTPYTAPNTTLGGSTSELILKPQDLQSGTPDVDELPAPCANLPMPRMAVIDVVIINSDSFTGRKYGVNLLDQLEIVANGSVSWSRTESDSSRTVTGSLALPEAGISYSLNVANARGERNEVVARPSLIAMDRRQSTFEGGESLYVGVQGNFGGQVYVLPAGVRLSVIPTFIDDTTMLLAVNASRTLFEDLDEPIGLFDEQLLSIRNSVTANVLLQEGQSLILSGLAERERQRVENKIPSEVNVPGLSETISREFTNSVTIILTPRSVKTRNEDRDGQEPLFATDEAAAYRTLLDEYAVSVGLDPAHDIAIQRAISPPTRAVLMSPSFLYLPAAQETL